MTWPYPAGGPLEVSYTDEQGRRWIHVPWRGWELSNQAPFLVPCVPRAPWWWRWLAAR